MNNRISGTREWAVHNINCVSGCSNMCHYCYAKTQAVRFKRKTVDNWKEEVLRPLPTTVGKKNGRIMFPTTHDIVPNTKDHCLLMLGKLLEAGNEVLLVSKPHLQVIMEICERFASFKNMLTFRFTIGSADTPTLAVWEPGAPSFEQRLVSLKHAFESGFQTSVSCEPMLDRYIDRVVEQVAPYVTDSIWLGKMNKPMARLRMNGAPREVLIAADNVMVWQSDENIKALYEKYKNHPKIKWKESIKEVVGIAGQTEAGQDI
jgi:DNA repair photolyase